MSYPCEKSNRNVDPYRHTDRPSRVTTLSHSDYSYAGSLPVDTDRANQRAFWTSRLIAYRQEPRSSYTLNNPDDLMLLYETLRTGPSDAVVTLYVNNFEFIARHNLNAYWRTIVARVPNLRNLRLSGSSGDQHLVDGVSPFPQLLGGTPGIYGALQKVTDVFIDHVRCSTLHGLLACLTGLTSLRFLSLRHIRCNQVADPADPPAWHHDFGQLTCVTLTDCDDAPSLGWLWACPTLMNRLHAAKAEMPYIDPYSAFFDARYIVLAIRAFCNVQESPIASVKVYNHLDQKPRDREEENYYLRFTLRNGAVAPFRIVEPFLPGFGGWGSVVSLHSDLDDLWQAECTKILRLLSDELHATGQLEYTQDQLTKGCKLCKRA